MLSPRASFAMPGGTESNRPIYPEPGSPAFRIGMFPVRKPVSGPFRPASNREDRTQSAHSLTPDSPKALPSRLYATEVQNRGPYPRPSDDC